MLLAEDKKGPLNQSHINRQRGAPRVKALLIDQKGNFRRAQDQAKCLRLRIA